MNTGIALMAIGAVGKVTLRTYRVIRSKQFLKDQNAFKMYKGGFFQQMTRREAQLILGVKEGSDPKQIKKRHRELMLINHPDNGGSTYIATKINEAKDFLVK